MSLKEQLGLLAAQAEHDAEFERLDALLKERDDLRVLVVAAILCGRKGEIERTYVLEKLATSDTEYPQGMLDPYRLRFLIRALEADPRSPIAWMAEQAGMGDWTGRKFTGDPAHTGDPADLLGTVDRAPSDPPTHPGY